MTSEAQVILGTDEPPTRNRALRALFTVENVLAGIVLVMLVGITILGVVMRYVLRQPLPWLIEMQLAGMVWVAFLAAAMGFRYKAHVAIEIIIDLLPARAQAVAEVVIGIIVYALLGFLFYSCLAYLQNFVTSGRSTPILRIPYYLIYGVAPVACVLMAISYTAGYFVPALRTLFGRRNAAVEGGEPA
ncbi:hypothetical protein GCM10028820_14220 [Tessaracoccus terricola]